MYGAAVTTFSWVVFLVAWVVGECVAVFVVGPPLVNGCTLSGSSTSTWNFFYRSLIH